MQLNVKILSINNIGITIATTAIKNDFWQKTKILLKNRYDCEYQNVLMFELVSATIIWCVYYKLQ